MFYKFQRETASHTIAFTGTEREVYYYDSRMERTKSRWTRIIAGSAAIMFTASNGQFITVTPNTHPDSPKPYQVTWHDEKGAIMDEKHDAEGAAKACYMATWRRGAEVETIPA